MASSKFYAVLTGDIVASQKLSSDELNRVRSVVEISGERISHWHAGLAAYPVEFSRGDTWQFLLNDPEMALRAALFFRSAVLSQCGVDTRLAVSVDEVTILADSLALSDGPAFVNSGRGLDELGKTRFALGAPPDLSISPWISLAATLCDTLVGTWTQRQAELIHACLAPNSPTQSAIAASLNPAVSKQAVGKSLRAAHWEAVSQVLRTFEAVNWVANEPESEDSL